MKHVVLVAALSSVLLGAEAARAGDGINFAGDVPRAREVWKTFEAWLAAYSGGDLKGVMEIFDREVQFSFQGMKDQSYSDLQSSYVQDFKPGRPVRIGFQSSRRSTRTPGWRSFAPSGSSESRDRMERSPSRAGTGAWMSCAPARMASG